MQLNYRINGKHSNYIWTYKDHRGRWKALGQEHLLMKRQLTTCLERTMASLSTENKKRVEFGNYLLKYLRGFVSNFYGFDEVMRKCLQRIMGKGRVEESITILFQALSKTILGRIVCFWFIVPHSFFLTYQLRPLLHPSTSL